MNFGGKNVKEKKTSVNSSFKLRKCKLLVLPDNFL